MPSRYLWFSLQSVFSANSASLRYPCSLSFSVFSDFLCVLCVNLLILPSPTHHKLFVGHKLKHKIKITNPTQAKSFREASNASHRSNGGGCGNRNDNTSSTIPQNAHTCQ